MIAASTNGSRNGGAKRDRATPFIENLEPPRSAGKRPATAATPLPAAWAPESPFVDSPSPAAELEMESGGAVEGRTGFAAESPFVSSYFEGPEGEQGEDPAANAYYELVTELQDGEFDRAVGELVNEAAEAYADSTADVGRLTEAHFGPLIAQAESAIDSLAETLDRYDVPSLSRGELEEVLDQFAVEETGLTPQFQYFLKKFVNKAKSVVKAVSKIMPHNLILAKLKPLIQPLLKKVLKVALNKIPPAVRPLAVELAKKFLKVDVGEASEAEFEEEMEAATADPGQIQGELDGRIAQLMLVRDPVEREVIESRMAVEEEGESDAIRELDEAHDRFARELQEMEHEGQVGPPVQNFVAAVLPALRIGIKIIGRPKVVKFLAGLVAKLIQKYVGPQSAPALSQALVDAGLKLMTLEAPDQEAAAASNALAATVEETVRRVAAMPDYMLEDEEALTEAVQESFEAAAARNMPPSLLKPALRRTSSRGAWVTLPLKGRRRYKKFSAIFDNVSITPQVAAAVRVFGGRTLADHLKEQMGLQSDTPVRARIHLYKTVAGTRVGAIARSEKDAAGINSVSQPAAAQFHPLTSEAAGMMLGEPGLGEDVPSRYLESSDTLAVGQTLYYLEVPGARPLQAISKSGTPTLRHPSQANLTIDFPKDAIRLNVYLGETRAQQVAALLRKGGAAAALFRQIRPIFRGTLEAMRAGRPSRRVKIIHEAPAPEQFIGGGILKGLSGMALEMLSKKLSSWFGRKLLEYLKSSAQEFVARADDPAEGVTIVVTLSNPPGLSAIRGALKGRIPKLSAGIFGTTPPAATVKILPGFVND